MALLSAATNPLYYTIGKDDVIDLNKERPATEEPVRISNKETGFEFIPGLVVAGRKVSVQLYNQVSDAGHFIMSSKNDTLTGLAFNFDRRESDLACMTSGELAESAKRAELSNIVILKESEKPVAQEIKQISQGVKLWKWFVIFALAFLLGEVILLRIWG
jgi:hypothetical protein